MADHGANLHFCSIVRTLQKRHSIWRKRRTYIAKTDNTMNGQFLSRVTGRVESWAGKVRCRHILGICFLITYNPAFSQSAGFVSYIADTHLGYSITCSPDGKNVYAGGAFTLVE